MAPGRAPGSVASGAVRPGAPTPSLLGLVGLGGIAATLAFLIAVFAGFAHGVRAGGGLPLGLGAALATQVALVVLIRVAIGNRLVAGGAMLGWLICSVILASPRPEGDLVIAGDGYGLAYLGAGVLLSGAAASWPSGGRRFLPGRRDRRPGSRKAVAGAQASSDTAARAGRG